MDCAGNKCNDWKLYAEINAEPLAVAHQTSDPCIE